MRLGDGIALVDGGESSLPLTSIVRVYHKNCCQNILIKENQRCPTLNWRSLTNYLDFIAVLESQANIKFPRDEVSYYSNQPQIFVKLYLNAIAQDIFFVLFV